MGQQNTSKVVWEVVEVEGWSRRIMSLIHDVHPYDDEYTVCGVPIPKLSLVSPDMQTVYCSKCSGSKSQLTILMLR